MSVNSINTYIVPTAANEVTMPSQPAFLAFLGAGDTDADVTGNGTIYQLGSGNALTEVFDQNADFNTNGTFTAPVTGRYLLTKVITFEQAAGSNLLAHSFATSNRDYSEFNGPNINAANNGSVRMAVLVDMDAADTAVSRVTLSGMGGDTADIRGSATLYTFFAGNLVV